MVPCHECKFGDRMAGIAASDVRGERDTFGLKAADEICVLNLPVGIGPEPIIGLVTLDKMLDLRSRPISKRFPQADFRIRDPSLPGRLRVAARQERLRIIVERPQELALPAVPRAWTDCAYVRHRQQKKQFQSFGALHDVGEIFDGLRIGNIAVLRGLAHD